MSNEDALALARLVLAGGPVLPRRRLLEAHGTPSAVLAAGYAAWRDAGLASTQADALRNLDDDVLASTTAWLRNPGHHLIGWHDADYPAPLRRGPSPPLALFVEGDPGPVSYTHLTLPTTERV